MSGSRIERELSPEEKYSYAKERLTGLLAQIDQFLREEVQSVVVNKDNRLQMAVGELVANATELRTILQALLQTETYPQLHEALSAQKKTLNNIYFYAPKGGSPFYLQDLPKRDVIAFNGLRESLPSQFSQYKSVISEVLDLFFSQEKPFQSEESDVRTEIQAIEDQIAVLQQQIRQKEMSIGLMDQLVQFFDQDKPWDLAMPLEETTYSQLKESIARGGRDLLVPTWQIDQMESPQTVSSNMFDENRSTGKSILAFSRNGKTMYLLADYGSDPLGKRLPQRYFLTPDLAIVPPTTQEE